MEACAPARHWQKRGYNRCKQRTDNSGFKSLTRGQDCFRRMQDCFGHTTASGDVLASLAEPLDLLGGPDSFSAVGVPSRAQNMAMHMSQLSTS
jgi:hypothetical protein